MLKNLYFVTDTENKDFYETTYGWTVDSLRADLLKEGTDLSFVYSPEKIDLNMLSKESMVITDKENYLESFLKARGNVVFFSKDGFMPWGVDYVILGWEALNAKEIMDSYFGVTHATRTILETERLIIRESTVDDVDEFYRIYAEEGITDYTEELFEDPEDEKRYMQNYIREIYGFYGFGVWTLVLKETGKVIGRAGISVRDGFDEPEIGYVLEKGYHRQGIAYEACSAIIDYFKENYSFDRIMALSEEGNVAGNALLHKLGFEYERDVKERGRFYQKYSLNIQKTPR
ncbi:MAG: GNAT family N-acetyltransferase [Lachnospiraceae bacterium]|nr:GNAT family N-acetyltransferase [Lachnospiraceae bacterium]